MLPARFTGNTNFGRGSFFFVCVLNRTGMEHLLSGPCVSFFAFWHTGKLSQQRQQDLYLLPHENIGFVVAYIATKNSFQIRKKNKTYLCRCIAFDKRMSIRQQFYVFFAKMGIDIYYLFRIN